MVNHVRFTVKTRIISFLLLFCFLSFLSPVCVQAQTVTIPSRVQTVKKVMDTIEKQTGYKFFYNNTHVDLNREVSINANNKSLSQVLEQLFDGTDISYQLMDKNIVLSNGTSGQQKESSASGQAIDVHGKIVDSGGEPVAGAAVMLKGTNVATISDVDGNYSLKAPRGGTLVISCLGFSDKEIPVSGSQMDITMQLETELLQEVVVTALGIKRSEKALSYNVQQMDGEEITTVKSTNFMNSLSGKVAGLNINASSAGVGGATRVVMRGPKSINQSNQALYVIDGVPITNRNGGSTSGIFVDQPSGEGISDVNPEDIESISVLSGPAAAALYGSAAAQGVIMITTKQGRAGKVSVTASNSTQFSSPFIMPEFQDEYPNRPGEVRSWGEKGQFEYKDYDPKKFFNTSVNIQNNVSITMGNEKNQTYASFGTTNAQGIIPNNKYNRYNFSFRNLTKFLNDKLSLDFSFNLIKQDDKNMMAQGQYFNPLVPLYLFPRGESFDAIRTFELWDSARGIYVQNWNYGDALQMQNPYWVAKRMNRTNNKLRYMVSASLKYQITDWLDVTGRIRWDDAMTKAEDKRYASTINLFAHSDYGFYKYHNIKDQSFYGDLMANMNKTFGEFSLSANLGISMSRTKYDDNGYQGGLKAPSNIFTPNAIDYGNATNDNRPIYNYNRHFINSAFANVELGWRNMLYLTVTGRNDWDSALSGTKHESFFYPSVGLSAIISQMVKMPELIDYLKVRGSWASVGSAISPNITSKWRYSYNPASQSYETVTYKFPETFYPERTESWEAGLTARLFGSKLSFDLTYYNSNTRKQTFLRPITGAQGFDRQYVQTGNVRNRGIELNVGYNQKWGDFEWSSTLTYSMNRNKIIDLLDDPDEVIRMGGLNGAEIILKKGGTMGDVYTFTDFARDNEGNIAIDSDGNVIRQTLSNPEYRGNVLPKGNIGFTNEFSWRGINLGFLISARLGGIVLSQTQAILDYYGVSKKSAEVRDAGGVPVNTGVVSAESYYSVVGGDNPIWSEYIYSGTNVRLQEAHIGYTFPKSLLGNVKLYVGLTANNLFMIYCKAPFDPESTASTGTYYQGFDYFMQPSLRSFGFNVKLNF